MKKINYILQKWPQGALLTINTLKKSGITAENVKKYIQGNLLERVGRGAYKLKNDKVTTFGIVYGLQQEKKIHIGGKTALELLGYGHYLKQDFDEIFLFSQNEKSLPTWIRHIKLHSKLSFHHLHLFRNEMRESLTIIEYNKFDLKVSAPERAILETLYFVPNKITFDEAFKLMESLTALRPQILQKLLESCNSFKVKRIFLFMAEKLNYFWFRHLQLQKIDLGKGKRVIVKRGQYNNKYKITVPSNYVF
ncbi:MAG: type IV toxin-antitoxin system AbiEi family antitoxin [Calditrichia bacterium]